MSQPECRPEQAVARRKDGTFKKGRSGNPGGRPGHINALRAKLATGSEEVAGVVLDAARNGDMQACRLILERMVPAIKPVSEPIQFDFSGSTPTDQARSIMAAIAAGDIPPDQGRALIEALASVAKIAELDELSRRLEALEAKA
ncbi:DUF5681 domain-containing protein [Stutzerimonas kunmingensis]|uniref:DUF5681 domain-containing protein n=1 Tax=Stutzerimonas kunmingensis TaxID=1211807 RepID=UPI0028AB844D|nr:DUF5681 domain-containing protein [Stutzerimonas kunmingensis]